MALSPEYNVNLPMRPASDVMDVRRLGSYYPFRLSFGRALTRALTDQHWQITPSTVALDERGCGEIVYTIRAPQAVFTFAAFLDLSAPDAGLGGDAAPHKRWDVTAVLCAGDANRDHLATLRREVPKQELGRLDTRSLVLTRGNRHAANFNYIASELAEGRQPDLGTMCSNSYLFCTTEVFGSGKFGMCDWDSLKQHYSDLARPFAAEMLACYLLRQVSFDVIEHVARQRAPQTAARLDAVTRRYIGIGNSAGLGMAPFLIHHPLLVHRWIECREVALARIRAHGAQDPSARKQLGLFLKQARQHLSEIAPACDEHLTRNHTTISELGELIAFFSDMNSDTWEPLIEHAGHLGFDTQEILNCCLIELHPELVDDLVDSMSVEERYDIRPEQSLRSLKKSVEQCYDWALAMDFRDPDRHRMFWFRADRAGQPRLGTLNVDDGYEKRMNIAIALRVQQCYEFICGHLERSPSDRVAHFLISFPALRGIVRRIQTMAQTRYGEIRVNVLDVNFKPEQLIRCALSFFGAGKFDSDTPFRVCNTMFQGAPLVSDLDTLFNANKPDTDENWSFAVVPERPHEILL